jgi:MFS family permease
MKAMTQFSREFFLVTVVATLVFISSTIIQPFFSLYIDERGISPIELGLIISLMSYTTLMTRMPLGLITSRIGIWWVVPLALIGQSGSYLLYSLATQPVHFYVIRVFHALAVASLHPILMALALTASPKDRKGEGVGIYLTSVGISMMSGPLLCSLLLSYFNYRTILLLSSIIPLSVFPIYLSLVKTRTLGRQLSRATRGEKHIGSSWSNLKAIISLKPVQTLTYIRFTFAFSTSIITTLYAIYAVNDLHIDPAIFAIFFSLRGLANTLIRLPTGRISDTIGRKKPLLISFTLLTAVFLLLSEVKDPFTIGFVMFLFGIAHGIRAVSEWSFLGDVVPSSVGSLANFYFSSIFDLGAALGATFAGSVAMMMSTSMILKVATILIASSILVIALTKVPQKG